MKLTSPWPFPERLLLFGGGGSGKTNSILNIARYTTGRLRVVESDYSAAYQRALATDYTDVAERVHVEVVGDWSEFISAFRRATAEAEEGDWVVVDSASPSTYQWVQDWTITQTMGNDLSAALIELRAKYSDPKQFQGQMLKLLPWEIVKKEYSKFWRGIQQYQGNMVLTAEAKSLGYYDRDDNQTQRIYGPIGAYPAGQDTIRYAMSTTLFLEQVRHDGWTMTTVKDRNREVQDRVEVDEFAVDYLMTVAGWGRAR